MIKIRDYRQEDAKEIGLLIAETYSYYNLSFLPEADRGPYLGPFQHAHSNDEAHQEAIAQIIQADVMLVAENDLGKIVGVLRGNAEKLQSLFVRGDHHRRGIGRLLVNHFENYCRSLGSPVITLAASLYAVPFYQSLGYKKSDEVQEGWSFDGEGFRYQPMEKTLN